MSSPSEPAMASTPVSELSDGPVLSVINKRLCALRKKHNRIFQMEESRTKGKTLNKEQEETLRSKSVVITAIDELEKLRHPLVAAVVEEARRHLLITLRIDPSESSDSSVDAIAGSPRDDREMRSTPPWTAVDDKCFGGSVE
ncbi:hypothetical protein KY284_000616 [Solanum tuberosum]|nr:hypothetical protein KY284_000616 [Solanum tuberosum]